MLVNQQVKLLLVELNFRLSNDIGFVDIGERCVDVDWLATDSLEKLQSIFLELNVLSAFLL